LVRGELTTDGMCRSRGFCGALSFEVGGAFLPELMAESKSTTGPFLLPLLEGILMQFAIIWRFPTMGIPQNG
jgi:hypothetical protein